MGRWVTLRRAKHKGECACDQLRDLDVCFGDGQHLRALGVLIELLGEEPRWIEDYEAKDNFVVRLYF